MDWQPHEPPLIVVGGSLVLDRWRTADGPALRRFDLDPDTARFFGYSVDQAAAMPDSHYDGDMRAQGNLRAWREGRELNLAIRRSSEGEAVGWVELRRSGVQAEVSYNITAELRGQGIAPRALSALLAWAATQIGLRRAHLSCHVDNAASQRVAEKCGFSYNGQEGNEYKFERELDLRGGPTRLPPRRGTSSQFGTDSLLPGAAPAGGWSGRCAADPGDWDGTWPRDGVPAGPGASAAPSLAVLAAGTGQVRPAGAGAARRPGTPGRPGRTAAGSCPVAAPAP